MPAQQLAQIASATQEIWSHPTWDILLMFALVAGGFFYGISAGKRRIAATIIYTYVALAVASALPFEKISRMSGVEAAPYFAEMGIFLAIFLLLSFLLGSSRKRKGFAPASSWWQVFILSFLQIGLLIHIILGFLPAEQIALLAPLTRTVFANPEWHLWWLLLPLATLIILRRFETKEE